MQVLAKNNGGRVSTKDSEAFEKFAFGGVKMKNIIEHVQSGNMEAFEADKKKIADTNGLTSDDVNYLLQKFKF